MISLNQVRKNKQVLEFIKQSDESLIAAGYTEHSLSHAKIVSIRAMEIAKEIGFSKEQQELSAIAGFCHDMGNFLSRSHHHYFGALLFHQIFNQDFAPEKLAIIMNAISNHDKDEMNFSNIITAVLVLADKTDVRRTRVVNKKPKEIKEDIHDRVNFATKISIVKINKNKKLITLILKIDTNFVPIIEYFEIFTDRMVYCRKAAKFLGYKFGLIINNFKLL
ncbi:MAG TPA: HD domain-containing protein [Candidatus Paceibacterota bacterium]|nr:HD domain-containing protein [Candidatus Paceibacterota bacterium]